MIRFEKHHKAKLKIKNLWDRLEFILKLGLDWNDSDQKNFLLGINVYNAIRYSEIRLTINIIIIHITIEFCYITKSEIEFIKEHDIIVHD